MTGQHGDIAGFSSTWIIGLRQMFRQIYGFAVQKGKVALRMMNRFRFLNTVLVLWTVLSCLSGCRQVVWNDPYPAEESRQNIFYSSFSQRPKHLDPARSYSSNEIVFTGQIYEPPLQYHFLDRPYRLIPLTAESVPRPLFLDDTGNILGPDADPEQIAVSLYRIHIRPGILFQPHPAFATNGVGEYRYHGLTAEEAGKYRRISDFKFQATRELTAEDYVYQVKRLAGPDVHSPILSLMSGYIMGLGDYARRLASEKQEAAGRFLDLRNYDFEGVRVLSRYTYEIRIRGKYPQFVYWLAMPFFAPVPWEVDRFYSQPGFQSNNLDLDWYPVGTGPYMLTVNDPNRRMVLEKNPNFRGEPYPENGEPGDAAGGFLEDAGRRMPFIDRAVYTLEKENIPYWNKFLQGYYDVSGISSDSFDQAVQVDVQGDISLTEMMRSKGIQLMTSVSTSTFYTGFNMMDPLVGGYSEKAAKLRQAISIAVNIEEFISIFSNGRGVPAQGPLPPGIFGYRSGRAGINPVVYEWKNGRPVRRSIDEAKRLLAEAGYPGGRHAETGKPLVLYLDTMLTGPDGKSRLNWMRKQFAKLDIQLVVRSTDYNRFQEKMRTGNAQIFQWGWNADYPDPENFFFLLYGPNSKAVSNGENAANYDSPRFNRLFEKMRNMENCAERMSIIDEMMEIVRHDSPWVFGFHPKDYALYHQWLKNMKPNLMANNTLKYRRINPEVRYRKRFEWNRPVLWPMGILLVIAVVAVVPAVVQYRRRSRLCAFSEEPESGG